MAAQIITGTLSAWMNAQKPSLKVIERKEPMQISAKEQTAPAARTGICALGGHFAVLESGGSCIPCTLHNKRFFTPW